MKPRSAIIWMSVILSLVVQQCDLFSTRDPDPPVQNSTSFKPPVTPDIVLDNLKNAVAEVNTDNYIRCFTDSSMSNRTYQYYPSVEISAQYPGVFSSWSVEDERRYFQNLGTPAEARPYLTFNNSRTLGISSDSVVYSMDYSFYYPHRRSGITQLVQGNMELYLAANDQRQWSIYRWQDHKTVSDSTWSLWRAIFSGS